jgi:hypothetical protein
MSLTSAQTYGEEVETSSMMMQWCFSLTAELSANLGNH